MFPQPPLAGIVVVELGASVAAPAAGQILGDLGAEVIKVEKADGDDARKWGPPFVDGASATFQSLNRNKRSVVCDLRNPDERSALVTFILEKADVVLQNLRPGQADALGLGAAALTQRKPQLIYCNIGAFGRRGPLSERPGYDPLMQAFGGIMSAVGEEGRPPVRVGPSIVDVGTALWAVIGIVSQLYERKSSGKGSVVDVSLFETAATWMQMYAAQYSASGELPKRAGSGQAAIVPYRAYRTADGDLVVAAGNNSLFRKLCRVLGHPEWGDDPRFRENADRVAHHEILYGMIEPAMAQRSSAQWTQLLDAAGVPCAPVQNVGQMLAHEQLKALGLLQEVSGSSIPLLGLPISFDGKRPQGGKAAPALGQHTKDIL
jgi:crotonobetainyl-CoA:carnitine CoA-transferase CaiB-like acyl-CoA transferase